MVLGPAPRLARLALLVGEYGVEWSGRVEPAGWSGPGAYLNPKPIRLTLRALPRQPSNRYLIMIEWGETPSHPPKPQTNNHNKPLP